MRDALNATGKDVYFSLCGWNSWYGYGLSLSSLRLSLSHCDLVLHLFSILCIHVSTHINTRGLIHTYAYMRIHAHIGMHLLDTVSPIRSFLFRPSHCVYDEKCDTPSRSCLISHYSYDAASLPSGGLMLTGLDGVLLQRPLTP